MRATWRHRWLILATLMFWLCMPTGCASTPAENELPAENSQPFELPALRLPTPTSEAHRDYLGVGSDDTFALAEIKTRILIIEVFNFYCPHCQAEAPNVNRMYRQIESDPQLRGQIKIIGIGIGNTPYEINSFRRHYTIPFPLFADRSRVLSKQLEVRQTPTFIAWHYRPDDRIQPLLFAPGSIGEVEAFLEKLVRASDLDRPKG